MIVRRVVADIGNSRLKWALVNPGGGLGATVPLPLDAPSRWAQVWDEWQLGEEASTEWAVSSVNPPAAERLASFLATRPVRRATWFQTASDVPIEMDVEGADTGGADRALAVLATLRLLPPGRPGLVVSCGTAITIERITIERVWQGGVIAPGLFLSARALHLLTAQLPLVTPNATAPAWGRSTEPSLEAGVFWGAVGALRELLARQTPDLGGEPFTVWTGGDAPLLAGIVSGGEARVVPDLVLHGLAAAGFN